LAALRTGPTDDVHACTLAFARELASIGHTRRRLWPGLLSGLDPALAVEEALAEDEASIAR
jgi:hypothetical protein